MMYYLIYTGHQTANGMQPIMSTPSRAVASYVTLGGPSDKRAQDSKRKNDL